MKKIFTLDSGKNTSTFYNSHTGESGVISHVELLNLPFVLDSSYTVIGEYSHFGCPREKYSLSQPFTAQILQEWYDNFEKNGIELKLFPQKSTPRACSYSGLPKTDLNDPKSIYKLVADFPEISLMNPPKSFEPSDKVKYFWSWKDETNQILNVARMTNYDLDGSLDNWGTKFILKNLQFIYDNLSDDARSCFGFQTRKKCGSLKVSTKSGWSFSMPQIFTILSFLVGIDGEPRLKENGNFPSNYEFMRYLLCATPFHFRGGVGRSNIYYHGMMNWIIKIGKLHGLNLKRKVTAEDGSKRTIRRGHFTAEEEKFFVESRAKYRRAIIEVYSLFKVMLRAEFGINNNVESLTKA